MSVKQYQFAHRAELNKVTDRMYRDLQTQAREHGMTLTRVSDREFTMKRTGADLRISVGPSNVTFTVDLSFFAEPFRGQLEAGLNVGMPTMLRECERA